MYLFLLKWNIPSGTIRSPATQPTKLTYRKTSMIIWQQKCMTTHLIGELQLDKFHRIVDVDEEVDLRCQIAIHDVIWQCNFPYKLKE
jgi:hypothetical protein